MQDYGFKSKSGLSSRTLVCGILRSWSLAGGGGRGGVLQFPPLLHQLMGSANEIKAKTGVISTLSNLIGELSLHTTWQMACCT